MRAGLLLAVAHGACLHVSQDGRFCCPSWCDGPCGGPEGLCSHSALEEVGTKECGKFAPPCLIPGGASASDVQAEAAPVEPEKAARFLAPTLPPPAMPSPEAVAAVEQPLDEDLEAAPTEDMDVAVEAAARTNMITAVEDRISALDKQVEAATAELEQQQKQMAELEQVSAPPAGVPKQPGPGQLLRASPLPDVRIPELGRVKALTADMAAVERSWEAANASAVEEEERSTFKSAAQAVKRAARDRALLDDSLVHLGRELSSVHSIGQKLRSDAHLGDINPALLRDLHNLRRGAFMQTSEDVSGWASAAQELHRKAREKLLELELKLRGTTRHRSALTLERAAWAATLARLRTAEEQAEAQEEEKALAAERADADHERQDVALEQAAAQASATAAQAGAQAAGEAEALSSLDGKAARAEEILSKANRTLRSSLETAGGAVRSGIARLQQGSRELQDVQDAGTLALNDAEKASFAESLRKLDRAVTTARQRSLALRADEQALLSRVATVRSAAPRIARAVQTAHDAVGVLGETAMALGKSAKLLQRQAADALADEQALKLFRRP